jgi:hypothetical protein
MFSTVKCSLVRALNVKRLLLLILIIAATVTSFQVGTVSAVFECPAGTWLTSYSWSSGCNWCWQFWQGKYQWQDWDWTCSNGSRYHQDYDSSCGAC